MNVVSPGRKGLLLGRKGWLLGSVACGVMSWNIRDTPFSVAAMI